MYKKLYKNFLNLNNMNDNFNRILNDSITPVEYAR